MRELLIVLIIIICVGCVGDNSEETVKSTKTENFCEDNLTSVSDIRNSSEAYLNKNVTLQGAIYESFQSEKRFLNIDYLLEDCQGHKIYLSKCRGEDGGTVHSESRYQYRVKGVVKVVDTCVCEIELYGMWKALKPGFPLTVEECEKFSDRRCKSDTIVPIYYLECTESLILISGGLEV